MKRLQEKNEGYCDKCNKQFIKKKYCSTRNTLNEMVVCKSCLEKHKSQIKTARENLRTMYLKSISPEELLNIVRDN